MYFAHMKNLPFLLLIPFFIACSGQDYPELEEPTSHLRDESLKPFYHGVASGDPTPNSVIIWTRVTPGRKVPEVRVRWEVASDPEFQFLVESGEVLTGPEQDYTVKVDVGLLEAGTLLYYRFKAFRATSMVGRTKTLPQEAEEVTLAAVSCSNYEWGYFNAYDALAKETEVDAVLHLGDYIYEYGPGTYGDTTLGRTNIPRKEIISLTDYRTRYSQYRLDPDLREVHAAHPFINIWDDHEITNNSYKDGAQNHQENEGSYQERKAAAVKAYYEWIPIRETGEHYRDFEFGELADVIMLDERLAGRTRQPDSIDDPMMSSEEQSMLGDQQLEWFLASLENSDARWKVIGNQVIFSYLNWGRENFNINLDSWDGYPLEQQKIIDFIREKNIENVIFLTGDTHSSWAFEVTNDPFDEYDPETAEGAVAVEFGTTSINSGNSDERFPADSVKAHEDKIVGSPLNPHLKFANLRDHGYLVVTFNENEAIAEWKYVSTLKDRSYEIETGKAFAVDAGTHELDVRSTDQRGL